MMKKNLLFILTLFLCSLSYAQVEMKLEIDSTDIKIRPLNALSIDPGFENVNPKNINLSNFNFNSFKDEDQTETLLKLGINPLQADQNTIVIKKTVNGKKPLLFEPKPLISNKNQ
ncbi:hypothetical protein [Psychroflexus tropicus]|uniref:hypothetical protein n=1 Tax=Psychroflexus tropicus TaxID=197345 RepID=UPI00039BFEC7|nr:hypothetical protein [Psychroflexus tropicus]